MKNEYVYIFISSRQMCDEFVNNEDGYFQGVFQTKLKALKEIKRQSNNEATYCYKRKAYIFKSDQIPDRMVEVFKVIKRIIQ